VGKIVSIEEGDKRIPVTVKKREDEKLL